MASIDLALKHKIWGGKADVSLRFTDIFDTQRFAIVMDYDDKSDNGSHVYNNSIHDWESRNVFVGFSYRFGKLEMGKGGRGRGSNGKGNEGSFDAGDGGGM